MRSSTSDVYEMAKVEPEGMFFPLCLFIIIKKSDDFFRLTESELVSLPKLTHAASGTTGNHVARNSEGPAPPKFGTLS